MHLLLHVYPGRYQMRELEDLKVDPCTPYEIFLDQFGNRCTRLLAPAGKFALVCDGVVEVDGLPDEVDPAAVEHDTLDLPHETLQFLHPSRYCDVDLLEDFAWKQFGHIPRGYGRVRAICDWVHNHIEFGYSHACKTKTAYDVFQEGKGVCRDFAHLGIAICRSLGLPARYTSGYLGDIGVPPSPDPMDFSAWYEVFLSNRWYTFDPRHNMPRIGRIVMAYGRDAADTALTTTFGPTVLEHFCVCTEEVG
jgi:transglutaminase-like putative cysteine protease